jgi:hypothetical protein
MELVKIEQIISDENWKGTCQLNRAECSIGCSASLFLACQYYSGNCVIHMHIKQIKANFVASHLRLYICVNLGPNRKHCVTVLLCLNAVRHEDNTLLVRIHGNAFALPLPSNDHFTILAVSCLITILSTLGIVEQVNYPVWRRVTIPPP